MKRLTARKFPFRTLQESWQHYFADILADASEDKQRAMHSAFYAGATSTYFLFLASLETPSRSESRALAQALFEELDEFMKDELEKIILTEGNA